MRHVESSNAFVYLMNIPNGVVVSTILLKIIPAPVLRMVLAFIASSASGIYPYSPTRVPVLHIMFIGPQLASYLILLGDENSILVSDVYNLHDDSKGSLYLLNVLICNGNSYDPETRVPQPVINKIIRKKTEILIYYCFS
mgnify:CR=1 FL=1